ncbi:MAG: hypothetical protein JO116_00730 [Planctomycetaceae bacterium]|jgi:hypothetical protein|nr:hypothetical protein [Planctomycetaceae bacterium]MBV8554054.1 hypothetical protein [Planctomycetaceae bacterium]
MSSLSASRVSCQNWDISQQAVGAECPPERIVALMLALQERGCHNINCVTPEHVAPQVIAAIAAAIPRGLRLPSVYNTSAWPVQSSGVALGGEPRKLSSTPSATAKAAYNICISRAEQWEGKSHEVGQVSLWFDQDRWQGL